MSSALVGYSSGEEEEKRDENCIEKRADKMSKEAQQDVNYDDVQMELSDNSSSDSSSESSSEEESKAKKSVATSQPQKADKSNKISPERELFTNESDYRAYKNQFSKNGSSKDKIKTDARASEYGTVAKTSKKEDKNEEASEYGTDVIMPVAKPKDDRLKRLRQISNEDLNAVVKESEEERHVLSVEPKKKRHSNDKERHTHDKDRHSHDNDRHSHDNDRHRYNKEQSQEKSLERHSNDKERSHEKSVERHSHSSSDDRRHKRRSPSPLSIPSHSRDKRKDDHRARSSKDRHEERHNRRRRSKSRSRERHSRRHRSRSSSRDRRHRDDHREPHRGGGDRDNKRQELRNRKLVALGLTEAGPSYHSGYGNMPTAAAMSAAMAVANTFVGAEQVEAQLAHVKAVTGIDLPKYYNPTAINPLKYAEQIKKRQLLWGFKKAESGESAPAAPQAAVVKMPEIKKAAPAPPSQSSAGPTPQCSFNKWEATNFGDNSANEKFRRLMGIKGGAPPPESTAATPSSAPAVDSRKMFVEQEMEYERARAITHTQRGLGLGFSSTVTAQQLKVDPNAVPIKPTTAGINFVKK